MNLGNRDKNGLKNELCLRDRGIIWHRWQKQFQEVETISMSLDEITQLMT